MSRAPRLDATRPAGHLPPVPGPVTARRLFALARPELPKLAIGTAALFVSAGLSLAYPQLVKMLVDAVVEGDGVSGDARAMVDRAALLLELTAAGTHGARR